MNEPEKLVGDFTKEINLSPEETTRFWGYVFKGAPNDCWLWTRSTDINGYGRFTVFRKKQHKVHRIAWTLIHGTIPRGMRVCHNCPSGDNPLCCNPAHLFLGTQKQNMEDAAKKGRTSHESVGVVYKFTETDIPIIRQRALTESARAIAKDLCVSPSAITAICRRERWSHVL